MRRIQLVIFFSLLGTAIYTLSHLGVFQRVGHDLEEALEELGTCICSSRQLSMHINVKNVIHAWCCMPVPACPCMPCICATACVPLGMHADLDEEVEVVLLDPHGKQVAHSQELHKDVYSRSEHEEDSEHIEQGHAGQDNEHHEQGVRHKQGNSEEGNEGRERDKEEWHSQGWLRCWVPSSWNDATCLMHGSNVWVVMGAPLLCVLLNKQMAAKCQHGDPRCCMCHVHAPQHPRPALLVSLHLIQVARTEAQQTYIRQTANQISTTTLWVRKKTEGTKSRAITFSGVKQKIHTRIWSHRHTNIRRTNQRKLGRDCCSFLGPAQTTWKVGAGWPGVISRHWKTLKRHTRTFAAIACPCHASCTLGTAVHFSS